MMFNWIRNIRQNLKDKRELKELDNLIKEADKRHLKTGKQYLIIPIDRKGHFSLVVGSDFINEYNRKAKKINVAKMTYPKLLEIAYYKTNNGTLNKR